MWLWTQLNIPVVVGAGQLTQVVRIVGTIGKYDQKRLWK